MAAALAHLGTTACGISEDRPLSAARPLEEVTTASTVETIPLGRAADGAVEVVVDRDRCLLTPIEVDGPVVRFTVNNSDRLLAAISVSGTAFGPVAGGQSDAVQMRLASGPVTVECRLYPVFAGSGRTVGDHQVIVR